MPAYSFKQRFIPMVEDGSKQQTIRARRLKGFSKKGDRLYLYFGLRTKHVRKLREEICTNVRTIIITQTDIHLIHYRMSDSEVELLQDQMGKGNLPEIGIKLDAVLRNALAWADGFRPDGSTINQPGEAFELMIRFWRQTHDLSYAFIGDLIEWNATAAGRHTAIMPAAKPLRQFSKKMKSRTTPKY